VADVKAKAETNGHGQVNGLVDASVDLAGVRIDPDKLKIRELVEIEKLLGRKVAVDMMTGEIGADLMQALLWIGLRRKHPQVTFEQAGEFDFDQVTDLLGADDEEPVEGDAVDPQPVPNAVESNAGPPASKPSKRSRSSATSTG
jgi:hypothetical protein